MVCRIMHISHFYGRHKNSFQVPEQTRRVISSSGQTRSLNYLCELFSRFQVGEGTVGTHCGEGAGTGWLTFSPC